MEALLIAVPRRPPSCSLCKGLVCSDAERTRACGRLAATSRRSREPCRPPAVRGAGAPHPCPHVSV